MNHSGYRLEARDVFENNEYDVVVLGGGPAGCAAAAAAAQKGARTILVEATGVLGGMGTTGLVPCFAPYGNEGRSAYGGIALKVLKNMMQQIPRYGGLKYNGQNQGGYIWIDSEILKMVYDQLLEESGADILFHARVCDVDMDEEGRIQAVLIAAADGLTAYRAKVYVDCTGNGLAAIWAGAEAEKGDENGELMPATLCFTVGNVQEYAYLYDANIGVHHGSMHPINPKSFIHKVVAEGSHPLIEDTFLGDNQVGPNTVGFSAGHIWDVDSTDPISISKAMIKGRKIAWEIYNVTKENFPQAFGGAHMMATANMVGHREGYRVKGDYELQVEDYVLRREFPDTIGRSAFEMDVHLPKDPERRRILLEKLGNNSKPKPGTMAIPYRCLTPKGLKNVLVAGRAISCERLVMGSVRVMPVCMVTGEAAGIAAAMAAAMPQCDIHQVDVETLRDNLRNKGAVLE